MTKITTKTAVIARLDHYGNTVFLTDRNHWAKDPASARRFKDGRAASARVVKERKEWPDDDVRTELLKDHLPTCRGCGHPRVLINTRKKLCESCSRAAYNPHAAMLAFVKYF